MAEYIYVAEYSDYPRWISIVSGCRGSFSGTAAPGIHLRFVEALLSHIAARVEKMPVTVFLVPCIVPFVPGAGMFHIVYSLIEKQQAEVTRYFFETMEMAGVIALAIFAVDTIFKCRVNVHTKCT